MHKREHERASQAPAPDDVFAKFARSANPELLVDVIEHDGRGSVVRHHEQAIVLVLVAAVAADFLDRNLDARKLDLLVWRELRLLRAQEGRDVFHGIWRSEEHTSELQSLMRISYAVFCLTKKKTH